MKRGRNDREKRQERAQSKQAVRTGTTAVGQIRVLDNRLGVGVGAVRERARLAPLVEQEKQERRSEK